jgi:hypothetical protein
MMGWRLVFAAIPLSLAIVVIASPSIWASIADGYPGDSFWTLSATGRIGVLAISTIGLTCIFALCAKKTKLILRVKRQVSGTAWALFDIAIGLILFGVVYSVSPQIFYGLYRRLIPNLPAQWVVDSVFDVDRLQIIAAIPINGSLADHLAGVALWAIIPFTIWMHMHRWWRG